MLVSDKHSSLLQTVVTYGRKKCYNIGPWLGSLVCYEENEVLGLSTQIQAGMFKDIKWGFFREIFLFFFWADESDRVAIFFRKICKQVSENNIFITHLRCLSDF